MHQTGHLCRLRRVSEPEAAPLTCAGVTVYGAVKNHVKALPGDTVVVIGAGGLGHLAVQVAHLLTAAHVVAVDAAEKKLESAKNLGAEDALTPTRAKKLAKTKPEVATVIDTVGANGTLSLGYSLLGTKGSLVVLGAAGGVLRYSGPDPKDRVVAGPILGSITDLRETLELFELGLVRVAHQDYPLEMVNEVVTSSRDRSDGPPYFSFPLPRRLRDPLVVLHGGWQLSARVPASTTELGPTAFVRSYMGTESSSLLSSPLPTAISASISLAKSSLAGVGFRCAPP